MIARGRFAICVFVALWALPVAAQTNPPAPQTGPLVDDPKACAPGERLVQGSRGPTAPSTAPQDENLTDKLARTEGVICPPNVDQGINAPTPDAGKMPIIPPPGSPGGDPNVRPK